MAVVVMEQGTSTGSLAPAVKVRMEVFVAQVAGVATSAVTVIRAPARERGGSYARGLLARQTRRAARVA